MYFKTSERYKNAIYNTSLQSVVNIYLDNVLLNPKYLVDFKTGCELFDDNLELGSVPSQYIEMQIHKKAGITKPKIIRIEYGILVNNALTVEEVNKMLLKDLNKLFVRSLAEKNNSFEIIPIGTYNIDDYNEEDDDVINIKALDNIIKLDADDGYYDASELINEEGKTTLGEIAQDICNKKGLELASSSFLNANKEVSVYDNQIKAREYMSYIAECAGCFCRANREGKIEFRKIGQDTVEIPLRLFKNYKFGDEYKISKVAYEDGIRSFKFGNQTRNTLWIRQDNMFIVDEEEIQNIYNQINGLTINSFEGTVIIDPAIDIGDKIIINGKPIIYQGELSLNKRFIADIRSKINIKEKQETTTKQESKKILNRRIQSEINQLDGKITQIAEQQTENTNKISEHTQTIEGFTNRVSSVETRIDDIDENIDTTVAGIVDDKVDNKMQSYPTKNEMNSAIDQKAESITQSVNQVKTQTIIKAEVMYALSSSETTAPTSGWSTTAPAWQSEKYMWQKTINTYGNGTKDESEPTCISGANGKDGINGINGTNGVDGKGVQELVEQYYLSTSNTTQTGGEWKETQDEWSPGKYIWTRNKITWTNNTTTYTTPILATGINQANETASEIKQTADNINLSVQDIQKNKADKDNLITQINLSKDKGIIQADKLDINGKAVSFTTNVDAGYTYTSADATRAFNIALGSITPTTEDINKLDTNGNEKITVADAEIINRAVTQNNGKINGTFQINPYSAKRSIILKNYQGKISTSIGLYGITTNELTTNIANITGSLRIGNNNILGQKTIYENNSGTTGTVSFDSGEYSTNYNELEIFYNDTKNDYPENSVRVASPNGKKVALQVIAPTTVTNTTTRVSTKLVTINSSSITVNKTAVYFASSTGNDYYDNANEIAITKVVGYK